MQQRPHVDGIHGTEVVGHDAPVSRQQAEQLLGWRDSQGNDAAAILLLGRPR